MSRGLQGRVGTRSRPGRSSPALLGCTSLGPIRHLFVLVPCQRLCRFPHPLSITLRPRPGESLARARHPSLSPPLRWDQTRSGEGEEREGGEKKTERSRGKTQRDSLAFNLFVFIYLFPPPPCAATCRQHRGLAGSSQGASLGVQGTGNERDKIPHSFGQGKDRGEELLALELRGTDFSGRPGLCTSIPCPASSRHHPAQTGGWEYLIPPPTLCPRQGKERKRR